MSRIGDKRINSLKNPEQYKVGVYIRTGAKVEGLDVIKFQRDRVEEYCADLNVKIIEEYIDDGVDVFTTNRPSYNRLIQDIKDGKINMIITANLPRIARSQKEMIDLIHLKNEYSFRTLFSDSREELDKDRFGTNFKKYLENEENIIDEFPEEEYANDEMDFL